MFEFGDHLWCWSARSTADQNATHLKCFGGWAAMDRDVRNNYVTEFRVA